MCKIRISVFPESKFAPPPHQIFLDLPLYSHVTLTQIYPAV